MTEVSFDAISRMARECNNGENTIGDSLRKIEGLYAKYREKLNKVREMSK